VTGLVIITGGFVEGPGSRSALFLQLKANPNEKVKAVIVKILISFMC
jgi:hypothetical protein